MSIQSSLEAFGTGLRRLGGDTSYNVYHYYRPMMQAPFVVWSETAEADDFHADNGKAEILMQISVDVFTQTEFDPLLDAVFDYLNDNGIPFRISSVDYEEATRLIHYSYECEMAVTETVGVT